MCRRNLSVSIAVVTCLSGRSIIRLLLSYVFFAIPGLVSSVKVFYA